MMHDLQLQRLVPVAVLMTQKTAAAISDDETTATRYH